MMCAVRRETGVVVLKNKDLGEITYHETKRKKKKDWE